MSGKDHGDAAAGDAAAAGDKSKAGGGDKPKMSPWVILGVVIIAAYSGVIPMLTGQIGNIFQMLKSNAGPILIGLAALTFFGLIKKK
jgi:hypothetical protein